MHKLYEEGDPRSDDDDGDVGRKSLNILRYFGGC